MSSHTLIISKDENSTTSLNNLFPCSTTPMTSVISFAQIFSCILNHAHITLSGAWWTVRSIWLYFFQSCLQIFIHVRSHLRLLFPRLNNPSSQPLLVCQTLQSLHQFHDLTLDSFQYVHVALIQGSLELDPALQMCLNMAEERRKITSLDLMVVLSLMQPKMLLTTFVTGYISGSCSVCCLPEPPGPFLQICFPAGQSPTYTRALGYFS